MQTSLSSQNAPRGWKARAPGIHEFLRRGKTKLRLWAKMRFYIHDAKHAAFHMFWDARISSYEKLSAELIFQFHKLEKGMCIPGKPRFFGLDPAVATCLLVERWKAAKLPQTDPVFIGAIETLRAYRRRWAHTPPPAADAVRIAALLTQALDGLPDHPSFITPLPYQPSPLHLTEVFDQLCKDRRSVRAYDAAVPPMALIEGAIAAAQLSPSACNRQPCHVHLYRDREKIDRMLALQNGNSGFGHLLSTLLVITADGNAFFDASERNEPYVDGGLFSMTLILALQARGLASCCLNWCVTPDKDIEAHKRGDIPSHHKIIMFMAVGYPLEGALAPLSARREIASIVHLH